MDTNDVLGPFQAGDGGLPPYLAGREYEQDLCLAFVSRLRLGRPPPREIVFYGPRGNGKTALLVWLQKEATSSPGVDVIRLAPAAIRTETKLVERLLSTSWWQHLAPDEISVYGIRWRPGNDRTPPLDEALAARVKKRPLVLLLDEAHTLDQEVGCALLNASQQVGKELPFLLVLAGTPELRSRLGALNATFWNRAERCPVGRLSPEASAAALRRPLEEEHIDIEEDATAHIVRESQGYPYFVQIWGEAVWRHIRGSEEMRQRIVRADAACAQAIFDRRKNGYYLERFDELVDRGLLPVARTVADAFAERNLLNDEQLETAITQGLGDARHPEKVAAARTALSHLGYVWRPEIEPMWEAGIPNLMTYVQRYVRAPSASSDSVQ